MPTKKMQVWERSDGCKFVTVPSQSNIGVDDIVRVEEVIGDNEVIIKTYSAGNQIWVTIPHDSKIEPGDYVTLTKIG